ncbi:hypothetical protein [Clostridium sp. AM58-1XD]|uniref:hypothetical protein n=1 Tax=Clostridium sp. AM58-1XD TaxID=2292307 RepID=UPI000E4A301D|nr:hypothetical protein [Clostridium sp. AM58-1XD]RGY95504.1 hypothetical protein DXA13_19180 [Clostridium sp. AM58-1XD]
MSFQDLDVKKEYRSKLVSISKEFYTPILKEAITYDRAVGFFSSTALIMIANGLIPFINNGGNIRLIASPRLSEEDITAIKAGYEKRGVVVQALLRSLYDAADFKESQRLNLLANLIADKRLDIKIALVNSESKMGMYTRKWGCLRTKLEIK